MRTTHNSQAASTYLLDHNYFVYILLQSEDLAATCIHMIKMIVLYLILQKYDLNRGKVRTDGAKKRDNKAGNRESKRPLSCIVQSPSPPAPEPPATNGVQKRNGGTRKQRPLSCVVQPPSPRPDLGSELSLLAKSTERITPTIQDTPSKTVSQVFS
jgi:hypothetical protein